VNTNFIQCNLTKFNRICCSKQPGCQGYHGTCNNPNPQFSKDDLTALNLNNFEMIEAMGLKLLHLGVLEWHYLRTKFHENLASGSEVISGGHTDRLVIFHFWKVD
jgi:hypothetical protein